MRNDLAAHQAVSENKSSITTNDKDHITVTAPLLTTGDTPGGGDDTPTQVAPTEWADGTPLPPDPTTNGGRAPNPDAEFTRRVDAEEFTLKVRQAAATRHREKTLAEGFAERSSRYPTPISAYQAMTNPAALAKPILTDPHTGDVLQREGHLARLLSVGKGGKTATGLDWDRCSITGEPFLGYFHMTPMEQGSYCGFIDPELDTDYAWYLQQAFNGLTQPVVDRLHRVDIVAAKAAGWTWESVDDRHWLGDQLSGCERVHADSALSLMPGSDARESTHSLADVAEFLDQFQALRKRVGWKETLVGIHPPGGNATKTFGSIMWDAKFQALWAISVDDVDGKQIRKIRGYTGRAGTRFREAEIRQDNGQGRVYYAAPDFHADNAAKEYARVEREQERRLKEERTRREAIDRALGLLPDVLTTIWDDPTRTKEPSKAYVMKALDEALKNKYHRVFVKAYYVDFWDAVTDAGAAVLVKKGQTDVVHPEGWQDPPKNLFS